MWPGICVGRLRRTQADSHSSCYWRKCTTCSHVWDTISFTSLKSGIFGWGKLEWYREDWFWKFFSPNNLRYQTYLAFFRFYCSIWSHTILNNQNFITFYHAQIKLVDYLIILWWFIVICYELNHLIKLDICMIYSWCVIPLPPQQSAAWWKNERIQGAV